MRESMLLLYDDDDDNILRIDVNLLTAIIVVVLWNDSLLFSMTNIIF